MRSSEHSFKPNEATELLEIIYNLPKARDFLEESIDTFRNFDSDHTFCSLETRDLHLDKTLREILNKGFYSFGLSSNSCCLYFMLDTKIYYKFRRYCKYIRNYYIDFSDLFSVCDNEYSEVHKFTGNLLDEVYSSQHVEIIEYFNNNLKLFPNSAQAYIKSKIEEFKAKPSLDNLKNAFEAKAWSLTLPEEFSINYFTSAINFFKKCDSTSDKIVSLGYVYEIICSKYENDQEAIEFALKFFNEIRAEVDSFFEHIEKSAKATYWKKIASMLNDCADLKTSLCQKPSLNRKYLCFLLETICDNDSDKKALIKQQYDFIGTEFSNSVFKFEEACEEYKEATLIEFKKQFFTNFDKLVLPKK